MADTKVSAFSAAAALAAADVVPILQSGANVKTTLGAVATFAHDSTFPGYASGQFYHMHGGNVGVGVVLALDIIAAQPFVLRAPVTIAQLGCRITTLAAGGNIQLAIYAANATTLQPTGNALGATGNITTAATGVVAANLAGGNTLFAAGLYWFGVNSDNATVILQGLAGANNWTGQLVGGAQANIANGTATAQTYWKRAQTFGTWPDVTALAFTEAIDSKCGIGEFKVA